MTARVGRISISPVKSLHLVHPDEVQLDLNGVRGDRRFYLADEHGRLLNGKRDGRLVQIHQDWTEATRRLALTFPDGRIVEGTVELGDLTPPDPAPSGVRVVRGPWHDAISAFVDQPLTLLWVDDGFTDRCDLGGQVSLVSHAALDRLAAEAGLDEPVDGRRFRMLFEIDGVRANEEDEWLGCRVAIGEATIAINGDVGRCAVTTHNPDTGEPNLSTLRMLGAYRREGVKESLPFGVYGSVVTAGRVRVGDPVAVMR